MTEKKSNVPSLRDDTIQNVQKRINQLTERGFKLPKNYSVDNALQSAWLMLQEVQTRDKRKVLEVCSRDSIAMSLFKMVQQGLNPAKNQCYFIPYGSKLTCMSSYFGNVLIGKRAGLEDVKANLILEGDEFEYHVDSSGKIKISNHKQPFENLDNKIIGAYCVTTFKDGSQDTDVMTIGQIKKAWQQGPTKGNSPSHRNFEGEMSKRTVTNRAIKMFVNSSDDSALIDEPIGETPTEAYAEHKIETEANKGEELSIEYEEEYAEVEAVYDVKEEESDPETVQPKQKSKPIKKEESKEEPQGKEIEFPDW